MEAVLDRNYLIQWLEGTTEGKNANNCLYNFAYTYLTEQRYNALLETLRDKDRKELEEAIVIGSFIGKRRFIKAMLGTADKESLVKILFCMIDTSGDLDEIGIGNISIDKTNKIFINYIQTLPVAKLKEIINLFLYKLEYLEEEAREDLGSEYDSDCSIEGCVNIQGSNRVYIEEDFIKEYYPHISDFKLLEKMKEYTEKIKLSRL
jgi:hypothetical protein